MPEVFWWVVYPYVTLMMMLLGLLYRYAFRQLSWAAPSTEFLEKKWLSIGSPLFHWGIIFAFIGHVMGIIIPLEFYYAVGINDHQYHSLALAGGGVAAIMVMAGLIILLIRKIIFDPVRIRASFADFFSLIALLLVAGTGTWVTLVYNTGPIPYDYRQAIGPWFRSLFVLQPKYELMAAAPMVFKIHVIAAFGLFASIPFTSLVHFYSLPVSYPTRAPQQYRSRSNYKRKGNETPGA
ncbi:respiratory nitrate reductase subunit gamma [Virgibacillus xinjiangensis]|uniref:Respiratory nitrate reductase subunit gamma n=1 Tax=Virgibacillus xinjiangensis TaxID=393090 RepID=A0ABV7CW85_9BACI